MSSPNEQAVTLLGAIHLLAEMRDELYAKELHGAGDEVARVQANLRRQLLDLNEEHHLEKILMPPLRTVEDLERQRAEDRAADLSYYSAFEGAVKR